LTSVDVAVVAVVAVVDVDVISEVVSSLLSRHWALFVLTWVVTLALGGEAVSWMEWAMK
jgi:hypothetical protein